MTDLNPKATWPATVTLFATEVGTTLPGATQRGMGIVEWRNDSGKRFVTFRPLFKAPANRETARARWTLWHDAGDQSRPALVLHLPLRPSAEIAPRLVALIDGWLAQDWTDQEAQQHAAAFADVEVPPLTPMPVVNEYELCEKDGFRVTVEANGWFIQSGRKRLTEWKSKRDVSRGDSLPLNQLDRLCEWFARNWDAVAYGKHPRPPSLCGPRRGVSACKAYKDANCETKPDARGDLQEWWKRHAFRAADRDLPNIFLERQGDEVVFSWDDESSEARSFLIFPGMESTDGRFAIPALRRLVVSRFGSFDCEPKFKNRMTEMDSQEGFRAARSTLPNVTDKWLQDRRFGPEDARDLARTGTALHPVVGLLRSAQGSSLSLDDIVEVLDKLRPNTGNRFQKLRTLAKGMDAHIDLRVPWESGYYLARQVRAELGEKETGYFDIETVVKNLGVEVCDVALTDPDILAVCVGSPQYAPLIAINVAHQDAKDPSTSGRRTSLAHELCHLLFDRTRMRGFARFEGGAAESDRLIEMRANAFAVELLAPSESFKNSDGTWMSVEEAVSLSASLEVSIVAISRHLKNCKQTTHEDI
jgi:Zn-dependent peptidase ImmA (M78 family)